MDCEYIKHPNSYCRACYERRRYSRPRHLEHMVDAVLLFEGDRKQQVRILRTEKNRFGSTDEVGILK